MSNPTKIKAFITETELRARIGRDLTQLIRSTKGNTELHILAIEIFTAIVNSKGNFYTGIRQITKPIIDDLLCYLGINTSQSGFIYTLLRECTLRQVAKEADTYKLVIPLTNLEVLAAETALSQEFLIEVLYFLYTAYKSFDKRDLNTPEASRFWLGIQTILISILQVPIDDRCYVYPLPSSILAAQLLVLLSINRNVENDVSNVDAILLRLSFEIAYLSEGEGKLVYPNSNIMPTLDKRQELCKLLMFVITRSVKPNSIEDRAQEGFAGLLDFEDEIDLGREEILELGEYEDEGNPIRQFRRRMANIRNLMRMRGRRSMQISDDIIEDQEEIERLPNNEGVALLRRVLENKVIEVLNEMLGKLSTGKSPKINIIYGPLLYSSIYLISTMLKGSPANVRLMIERGIMDNILNIFSNNLIPEQNCFYVIISILAAFTMHEAGVAKLASKQILGNVLNILIDPKYENPIYSKDVAGGLRACANDIKALYTQVAHVTKDEMHAAIFALFENLNKRGIELIKKLAAGDKEECKQYVNLLRRAGTILYALSSDSRHLRILLKALNRNNEFIKNLLNIDLIRAIICAFNQECVNTISSYFNISVIEIYLDEKVFKEHNTEPPVKVIYTKFAELVKALELTLDMTNKRTTLGDFMVGRKEFGKADNEFIDVFSGDKKLNVVFGILEWICKSAKMFVQFPEHICEQILLFITKMGALFIKECIIFFHESVSSETFVQEEIQVYLGVKSEHLMKPDNTRGLTLIRTLLAKNCKEHYRAIESLHEEVRQTMSTLIKQPSKRQRYSEQRTINISIYKSVAKCATLLLEEDSEYSLKNLSLAEEDLLASELKVMYSIMIVEDLSILLTNNPILGLLLEFFKVGGFERLQGLYQHVVMLIIRLKPQVNNILLEALKLLLTQIIKIYCNMIEPTNIVQALRISANKAILIKEGFTSHESLAASLITYVVESVLFNIKYGEYNTIVRFLAECVPNGFVLLVSALENYPRKNALMEIFNNPRSGTESLYGEQEIPSSFLEQLINLGYSSEESEEALRRNGMNVIGAMNDLSSKERLTSVKKIEESSKIELKKIDPKDMKKIVGKWLDYLMIALYESIYSISSYPCKYLLYFLSEFQGQTKVTEAFALLLNELRTLLFSIEFSYDFTLIPNENFSLDEIAEISITEKFMKKIKKYTAECNATEQELTAVYKMSALIDIITTFLRLSNTNELLKMMCNNKISQCLIIILSKLANKNLIIPGRKLLPKVLILLAMIYKEVHNILQGARYKAILMEDTITSPFSAFSLLPNKEETKKLVDTLCVIISLNESVSERMNVIKKSKTENTIITTKVLTAILLLLTHMTKTYSTVEIVLKSGILESIFSMKQIKDVRSSVPLGLVKKFIFNLLESPALLQEYMKRVIAGMLFAKTKYREKGMSVPKDEEELKELQKESEIELNRFMQSLDFLMLRDMHCFTESCEKVLIVQKELKKDSSGKMTAKHNLVLNKNWLMQMVEEANTNIPQVKLLRHKESLLTNEEYEYAVLLHKQLKESMKVMKKTDEILILQLVNNLINIQYNSKEEYVIPKSFILEVLGHIIRIYPESLALLLTMQSTINGNKLISFLISMLLPQGYISKDKKLIVDLEWKRVIIYLVKAMTSCNPHLNTLKERVMLTEMMKRIVSQAFHVLKKVSLEKVLSVEMQAQVYSSFTIFEGLFVSSENSIVNPKVNQYTILNELMKQNKDVINVITEIIKKCNFHSAEIEILLSPIVNVLEWITRFNKQEDKTKQPDTKAEEPSKLFKADIYMEEYNDIEHMEINVEQSNIEDDEFLGEEEIQLPKEIIQEPPAREEEYEDSDESSEEYIYQEEPIREEVKRVNNEIEEIQIQISQDPIDKNEIKESDLKDIYSIDDDKSTNDKIVNIMKGEVLGEEVHRVPETVEQRIRRMGYGEIDYYSYRMERLEEEAGRQNKLPAICLFGDSVDKKKAEEVLKNQILGLLETEVIEEKKPEVKKEEPIKPFEAPVGFSIPNPPQPEVNPSEENKDQNREEAKQEALVQQRQAELAQLLPNVQIPDNTLLLQIDLDFLRALDPELRRQSVQQLIAQHRPAQESSNGPADIDPATFIASIMDDNLRDEVLLTATPDFLAALPPDMITRARYLQERSYANPRRENREPIINPMKEILMVTDKEEKKGLAQIIFRQTSKITESCIETLIRLLFVNIGNIKIPLNNLFSNICCSKKNMYKVLNTLLFLLSRHNSYERYFKSPIKVIEGVTETKLTDYHFPPICLYRGIQYNHLVNRIIPLRILSLLSSLINRPQAAYYFFISCTETKGFNLSSVTALQEKLDVKLSMTPFEELLMLTKDAEYTKSERHLEALINFVNDLLNRVEHLASKREDSKKIVVNMMSVENVKQACQILYLEGMNAETFSKVTEILLKLSKSEENLYIIIEEIDKLITLVSTTAIKEWNREIELLNAEPGTITESTYYSTRTEIKMGRVFKLIKRMYDGYKANDNAPNKFIGLYAMEGDAIDTPSPKKLQKTISEEKEDRVHSYLRTILKKDILIEAFNALTELLSIIYKKSKENNSRKGQMLVKLIPSIESLIIAYDYCLRDMNEASNLNMQMKEIKVAKEEDMKELSNKYRMAFVFYKFTEKNHSAFNSLIRQLPYHSFLIMVKPFIDRFPNLLDFENKRTYFRQEQRQIKRNAIASVRVHVARNTIFQDSYTQLASIPIEELKGRLRVSFKNEEAADIGGVTREWYIALSKAMFNPNIGLFKKSAHGNTYQPDPKSIIQSNHLRYFKFIGRIIGKALLDEQYLECYFTRALYKILVEQPLTIQDMQDYDSEIYNSLVWARDHDLTGDEMSFSYTSDYFGRLEVKELIENGTNIKVTNENKQQFIVKMCKALLYDGIKSQLKALLEGIHEIIPRTLLSIFDSREIELMISGLPDVDLLDLRRNTEYQGYTENSNVIKWLWEVMEAFSAKERAEFLQFVTGTSKVPLDGFKNLPGSSGVQKFQIHKVYGNAERLPTAHTWYFSILIK